MSTHRQQRRLVLVTSVRWISRILAAGLLLLFGLFWYGEGPPSLSWMTIALCGALLGLVMAWYSELMGGGLILFGTACFYLLNLAQSGRLPGGWVFPLLFVSGGLFLYSSFLKKHREDEVLGLDQ